MALIRFRKVTTLMSFLFMEYIPNIFVFSKLIKRGGLMIEIIKFIKHLKNNTISLHQHISSSNSFIKLPYSAKCIIYNKSTINSFYKMGISSFLLNT